MVDEVDEQPLDVGPVLVLISHYHQFAIPEVFEGVWVVILLFKLQAHDFNDVVDFSIVHNLKRDK